MSYDDDWSAEEIADYILDKATAEMEEIDTRIDELPANQGPSFRPPGFPAANPLGSKEAKTVEQNERKTIAVREAVAKVQNLMRECPPAVREKLQEKIDRFVQPKADKEKDLTKYNDKFLKVISQHKRSKEPQKPDRWTMNRSMDKAYSQIQQHQSRSFISQLKTDRVPVEKAKENPDKIEMKPMSMSQRFNMQLDGPQQKALEEKTVEKPKTEYAQNKEEITTPEQPGQITGPEERVAPTLPDDPAGPTDISPVEPEGPAPEDDFDPVKE